MKSNYLLTCTVLFLFSLAAVASPCRQSLDGKWEFRQARGFNWYPATVPGTVHTDLMAAGVIEDPYFGFGERAVQWVDKEDWIYRRSFDLSEDLAVCTHIDLCFDGLDTYADVTLNGVRLLSSNNMFHRLRVPADSLLKPGGNKLEILFHSPVKIDMPKWEAYPVHYDPRNDQSENGALLDRKISIFARKAGYHYGWDWGPRIVTSGIWRSVYLEGWNEARLEDVFYRQDSVSPGKAEINAIVDVYAEADIPSAELRIRCDGLKPSSLRTGLKKGRNTLSLPFSIRKPHLWWCRGMGPQSLYSFKAELLSGGKTIDSRQDCVGLRSIRLERENDSLGRSFRFILNGVPVFMKGANYIPNDIFLPRVGPEEYNRVVDDAAAAGMNMLRVWGGGVYEDNLFYDLCDKAGILVWQDFMFSCSIYPYEGDFRASVLKEAEDNLRRLRNHACIALWCGNNECSDMWYGWKVQTGKPFDKVALSQFNQQYYHDLPELVERLAPGTDYVPTSPWSPEGSRNLDTMMGDTHLWAPWTRRIPSSEFERRHSRFYSEYGFQSFAGIETLMQFVPDTTGLNADSEIIMFHQRGGAEANRRIMNKLADEFRVPGNFAEAIYFSQIAQGDIVRRAIESHRRDKPLCWGTLVWQINDCWPVASWASRDWYGIWKPLHYYMRDAYREILPTAFVDKKEVSVWLVSDRPAPVKGRMHIVFEDYYGTQVLVKDLNAKAIYGEARKIWSISTDELPLPASGLFVRMEFTPECGASYSNMRMLTSVREASLPVPSMSCEIKECDGGYEVTVSTDVYAKGVYLNIRGGILALDANGKALPGTCSARNFSDNYFDLPAGEKRTVFIDSPLPPDEFKERLELRSIVSPTISLQASGR